MNIQGTKVNQRNMENSAETAPLLNDYKKVHFFERFIQTIFGGPVVIASSDDGKIRLPCYLHIYQFSVFISPLVLSAIFTAITEAHSDINYWMSIGFGCIMSVFMIILHIWQNFSAKKLNPSSTSSSDGGDIEFEGCCNTKQLFLFIINKKKWTPNLVIHSIFYGIVNGVIFLYLLPSAVGKVTLFENRAASVSYHIVSWVTSCSGLYGLIAKPPAEPCQFRTTDHYETLVLTRPFYLCIFGVIGILAMFYSSLSEVDVVMRIIFPCLPLFWILGMLPPIDCFFAWLGEQVLVHLFGGSPMASNLRLLLMLTLSGIYWMVIYSTIDQTAALTLGAFFGFLLSVDVASGFAQVIHHISLKRTGQKVHSSMPIANALYSWSKKLYFMIVIIAAVLISAMTNIFILDKKKESLRDVIGYIIISLFIIQRLSGNFFSSYWFFGSIINPLFGILRKGKMKAILLFIRKVLATCVVPLLLVTFVTLSAGKRVRNAALTLFTLRAYHFAWQDQHKCAFDVTILMLLRYTSVDVPNWWNNLDLHIQLCAIGLLRNRIQYAWNTISFASRFAYKFYFIKKVRHQSYKKVVTFTCITLPFVITFICLSIVLCAPLLPLFTLPIFLMGFPRPLIFWPHADVNIKSSSKDWIYYNQLTPSLLNCMKGLISSGSIGEVSAGEHFLARFQDRLVWIVIAEKGFMYTNIIVKGLELAETSCHTIEAGRIDDLFECILGDVPRKYLNPYPGHCLLPCDLMELDAYSDARNVLTGIIDRPDNLDQLANNFIKTLTWVLLRFSKSWRDLGKGDGPTAEDLRARPEVAGKGLPGNRSPAYETTETFVISSDTVEDFLREPSLSSHGKSSSSENSYTALWGNQNGPTRAFPMKNKTDNMKTLQWTDERLVPASSVTQFGKTNENTKQLGPKRSNLSIKDDFDDFGFDDFDDDCPRKDSRESKTRSIIDSILDTSSSDIVDPVTHDRLPNRSTLPSIDIDLSSPHSSLVEPPARWKQSVPVDAVEIAKYQDNFSEDWFRFVMSQLGFEEKGDNVLKSLSADRGLLYIYRRLVIACYLVVFEQKHTARDVWKGFCGTFPWSRFSSWFEYDTELYQNVLLAYRYAFKLMYDEAVLGPIDDFAEMAECLCDYEDNWHMGSDDDDVWVKAVLASTPNLASVGYNKEDGTFTSRILTKQKMVVPIGRIDSENVRAIWASLSMELLYFTNDDEERYSIQAHPSHLRNIIIQAADPPLGYPVYSSGLLSVVAW